MRIENLVLTRGWVVALCLAALGTALANAAESPLATWAAHLLRDLSLAAAGTILLALGTRHHRKAGRTLRSLAYPIGGALLFGVLIGLSVAGRAVLQSAAAALGPDAHSELGAQVEAAGRAILLWCALGVVAGVAGAITPVRKPAA